MATHEADPGNEEGYADAENESVFTDSEEEEGELKIGRRDFASDDEGEADPGELHHDQAAADLPTERLGALSLGKVPAGADGPDTYRSVGGSLRGDSDGYESEVEEDAAEVPGEQHIQEQKPPRKKAEPYDVPSSGAFWMHDDRMDDDELAASGRGVPKQKKLFDPDGGEDVWKHDRFELLDLPPEEDDYRGFLAGARRGGGRRGGRGFRGRQDVEPPPGYENGAAPSGVAHGTSQYEQEDTGYGGAGPQYGIEQAGSRGRGRGGRGRGRARSAVPINGHSQAEEGGRGGRSRRGRPGADYVNGGSTEAGGLGRGRGRTQSSARSSQHQGGGSLRTEEWPSLPTQQSSQRATQLNVGAKDYTPGRGLPLPSGQDPGRSLQPGAAPFAPPADALPIPEGGFIPGPLQTAEGGALQPPVRRPVSIQAPTDNTAARPVGGRGRGSRRYTASSGAAVA